jgi:photosystem II stability/assembly factor-like uncharacterized protein
LVSTAAGGIFRSADGGAVWERFDEGLPEATLLGVLAAPVQGAPVFALGAYNIWRSFDRGETWSQASRPTTPLLFEIHTGAVAPRDSSTIYVATGSGTVWRSTDAGDSWTASLNRVVGVEGLAVDPTNSDRALAATSTGALLFTRDGGLNWFLRSHRVGDGFLAVAMDPDDPSRVYVTTRNGVLRSRDHGKTWRSSRLLSTGAATSGRLAITDSRPRQLWTALNSASSGSLFVSYDQGATWKKQLSTSSIRGISASDDMRRVWVAIENAGVLRSLDGGRHWAAAVRGLRARRFPVIAADPSDGSHVLAVSSDVTSATWRSDHAGETWRRVAVDRAFPRELLLDANQPGRAYRIVNFTLERTTDGGVSWQRLSPGGTQFPDVLDVVLDPQTADRIYAVSVAANAVTWCYSVSNSLDGGDTWSVLSPRFCSNLGADNLHLEHLAVSNSTPRYVYASGRGLVRSLDGGASWESFPSLPPDGTTSYILGLRVDSTHPLRLWAVSWRRLTGQGVPLVSVDGGITWSEANTGLPEEVQFRDLRASEISGLVYLATNHGVFAAPFDLSMWHPVGDVPPALDVLTVEPDPERAGRVYAGTAFRGGLFVYEPD